MDVGVSDVQTDSGRRELGVCWARLGKYCTVAGGSRASSVRTHRHTTTQRNDSMGIYRATYSCSYWARLDPDPDFFHSNGKAGSWLYFISPLPGKKGGGEARAPGFSLGGRRERQDVQLATHIRGMCTR